MARDKLIGFLSGMLLLGPAVGDELRFDTASQWRTWQLPLGAVELTADGSIIPVEVRRNTDAVRDIAAYGGQIRNAGSNIGDAELIFDGDPTTGWAPDPTADPTDWFVELDLGRGVSAQRVTLVFDEAASPFKLFELLLSTGEPETDFIAAPIEGSLIYRVVERFKENDRHRVVYEILETDVMPIQYVRFEPLILTPGARLVEVEVETIGDNIALGMLERGGGIDIVVDLGKTDESVPLGNARALVDGDLYERWRHGTASRGQDDVDAHMILDLGAVYWLDQVRIIGGVVVRSGFGGGIITSHFVSRRRWDFRFYELMTSDGSLSPDGTRVWTKHFSGTAPEAQRVRGLVDHHFELIPTRYVRIFWKFWDVNCSSLQSHGEDTQASAVQGCAAGGTTDELQFYGIGRPKEVTLRSGLINLGGDKNINTVDWGGEAPPGTRIEIRTRTGNQIDQQFVFRDRNGKEITQTKWEKTPKTLRGAVDTTLSPGDDWSPWSNVYLIAGERFQSPSPRGFMEMEVTLVADIPDRAATLDFVSVNFTEPLARSAVGEIAPAVVEPGVNTQFTYFVRPQRPTSFDRLRMETSAPVQFMGMAVNGDDVQVESQNTAEGFEVTLPAAIRSEQLVELRFESSIFFQGTRFDVFLADSDQDQSIGQRVDPGDATDQVESNTNVVSLPVSGGLFANMIVEPRVLTPNGDGVNDRLQVDLSLVNVLDPRPLRLRVFDLAGRLIYQQEEDVVAGQQQLSWDGRVDGKVVAPGVYVIEMEMAGDARQERKQSLLSVVY